MKRASSWGQPLKNIITDYVEVSKDIATGLKKSPVKSSLWLVLGGFITAFYKKCPNLSCYRSDVIEYCNELGLCAEGARSGQAKSYVDRVSTLLHDDQVQYVSLGVVAIVMQRPSSPRCKNYHETCPHLRPRIWRLHDRVLDIGVWNQWVYLERNMLNFDINESEFST